MSFPEAAPPSASHRPLRSMEPEFHEKSQPSVAGEDATVAPARTDSTEIIRSFQQQSLEGGESVLDTLADETLHRGGSVSGFVQKSNSHADPYEADEFVLHVTEFCCNINSKSFSSFEGYCKRVIASGIDLVSTPVSKVMTKDPIFVLSDTGVMDAVQKMVQGKVKQSPVIENGEVIGLVRLNKCLFNFKSDDDGVFHGSMNASSHSKIDADSVVGDSGLTLKQLGLPSVLSLPETTTIYEACCQMAAVRADALVLVDSNALLCGILSSKDIVSLVMPSGIDFVNTPASKVMIKNPASVFSSSLAVEALEKMLQGELTQLLVIENGEPIALLDILSCLSHLFTHGASRGKHDKVIAAGFKLLESIIVLI